MTDLNNITSSKKKQYPYYSIFLRTIAIFIINNLYSHTLINNPRPIGYSINEKYIVDCIPEKTQDFATIIPGDASTYIFDEQDSYYNDYKKSYFAITSSKYGWDCMRHYEILANGCIPYFVDLHLCPENNMTFLPKDLIKEAMSLPGVSYLKIDHHLFDKKKYFSILEKILYHTRTHLTNRAMAQYLLTSINYTGKKPILFIAPIEYISQQPLVDYLSAGVCTGLKELFKEKIIDIPKMDYIYTDYAKNTKELYGKGFSYTRLLDDLPIDRSNIIDRIKNKEFEVIIYGCIHSQGDAHITHLYFHDIIEQIYQPHEIVYLCTRVITIMWH